MTWQADESTERPQRVELARRITGTGPPLVLVHGVAADGATFRLLEPLLAERFTVVSVERRGRCGSADVPDAYSLEAEFEDLIGVLDALDEPAVVFGHSFGANVALGAALRSSRIRRLVLFEPGRPDDTPEGFLEELEGLIERGERTAAMRLTLREFTRFPEEWIDDLLETEPWQERLVYAHTLAREVRAYGEHDFGDLSRLEIPTLLLVGGESPHDELLHAHALAGLLPRAHVRVLEGEGHVAPVTAPKLVAREILDFVGG